MATPRQGLVVEDKPTELSCMYVLSTISKRIVAIWNQFVYSLKPHSMNEYTVEYLHP